MHISKPLPSYANPFSSQNHKVVNPCTNNYKTKTRTQTSNKTFQRDNPFNSAVVKQIFIYKIAASSAAVLSAGLKLTEEGGSPPLNHNFLDLEGGYETTSKRTTSKRKH